MDYIIAGRFQTKAKADAAAATIVRYVDRSDICIFHNNAPGQHGTLKMDNVEEVSPRSDAAEETSATTALAAGLVAGAVGMAGGPVVDHSGVRRAAGHACRAG